MKSAEAKPATSSKSGPGKPFFTGAGEAVQEQEQRPAFFNYGSKGGANGIQTKLSIGKAGDTYEKEADATADKVVRRMAQPGASVEDKHAVPAVDGKHMAPGVQAKCAKCEQEDKLQKEQDKESPEREKIQKKPIFDSSAEPPPVNKEDKMIRRCEACGPDEKVQKSGDDAGTADAGLESRLNASKGGGSPLPKGTREHMESSMGADFSGVRVHTGSEAEQMNHQLHAQAFTHKNDIYFGKGKYDTGSKDGQHLLAHELTHVVQQGGAAVKTAPAPDVNEKKLPGAVPASQPGPKQTTPTNAGNPPVVTNTANPPAATPKAAATNVVNPPTVMPPGAATNAPNLPASTPQNAAVNPNPGASTAAAPVLPGGKAAPGGKVAPGGEVAPGGPGGGGPAASVGSAAAGGPAPAAKAAAGPQGQKPGAPPKLGAASKSGAGQKTDEGVDEQMRRLRRAPENGYKRAAIEQAAKLEGNSAMSRLLINEIALLRIKEIRQWFADKRNRIYQFFVGTGQDILNSIQQKQIQFMQMTISVMAKAQAFVADTEQAVLSIGTEISDALSAVIDGVSDGITTSVNFIADTITGFISSIPVPDIPGAAAIRNTILSLVNRAAAGVRGIVSTITQALHTGLTKVTQIISGIVKTIGRYIQQMLMVVFERVMSIQQWLFMTVRRLGNMVISRMNSFLQGSLFPMMQNGEEYLVDQVDEARLIRLMQIEDNQGQILKAMADVIDPKTKPKEKDSTATREQRLRYFGKVEEVGARRNAEIVAKFLAETSSFFLIAIHKVIAFSEYIYTAWRAALRHFKENIAALWNTIVQKVSDFVSEEIDKIKKTFSKFLEASKKVAKIFGDLVVKVKDGAVKLASSVAQSIGSSIGRMVREFITGGSSGDASASPTQAFVAGAGSMLANLAGVPQVAPQFVPQLQPQLQPQPDLGEDLDEFVEEMEELAPEAEEALELAEEAAVEAEEVAEVAEALETGTEAVVDGWEVVLVIVIVVVILVIVAIVAYLVYLLIEELLKPKPDPEPIPVPEPQPVPEPDPDEDEDECEPDEILAPGAPTGLTPADPIGIIWYKPLSLYENPIIIGGRTYRMTTTNQPLPPPFGNDKIGVSRSFLPAIGKPINMFKVPDRGGQGKFFRRLRRAGFSWRGSGGNRLSPDHVQDLFWNGTDEFDNLWPLDSVYNEAVGRLQNQDQLIFFRPDPKRPCAVLLSIQEARDRFGTPFMQRRRYIIVSIEEMP